MPEAQRTVAASLSKASPVVLAVDAASESAAYETHTTASVEAMLREKCFFTNRDIGWFQQLFRRRLLSPRRTSPLVVVYIENYFVDILQYAVLRNRDTVNAAL